MKGLEKFEPAEDYHIVNHVVGNENLFITDENYRYFLMRYKQYMSSVCSTLCYCLMPNHIHFLIRIHDQDTLSKHPKFKGDNHRVVMQQLSNLLNGYAKAYNKMFSRRGTLWINFTKRFNIDSDSYLTSTINYIHQNPVKHGFSKSIEDWQHSSFNLLTSEEPTWLARNEVIDWFGGREGFIKFHKMNAMEFISDWEY